MVWGNVRASSCPPLRGGTRAVRTSMVPGRADPRGAVLWRLPCEGCPADLCCRSPCTGIYIVGTGASTGPGTSVTIGRSPDDAQEPGPATRWSRAPSSIVEQLGFSALRTPTAQRSTGARPTGARPTGARPVESLGAEDQRGPG